jgi:predicted O-linked N-acetylglucosamine transferase (SPINDLY family)
VLWRALALQPARALNHCALGTALLSAGQPAEAAACCRRAAAMQPDLAAAHCGEGSALLALDELDQARAALGRAVQLAPAWAQAHCSLGTALQRLRDNEGAERSFRAALALAPDVTAANNLGNLLLTQCELDEAINSFRLALSLDASLHQTHSNLLLALNFDPQITPAQLLAEQPRLGAAPRGDAAAITDYPNRRDPERRLSIGFVSADLRQHPVGFFMEPLLESLERTAVSVFCYSCCAHEDELSARLRRHSHCWRDASRMTDEKLCESIRSDSIDILIDLSGHTAGNRLLVLARKPAPVQVSYLGYPNTTGLGEIDYVIGPSVLEAALLTERLVELPGSLVCYRPPMRCPDVEPLPAAHQNGAVTFGCLNNPGKR